MYAVWDRQQRDQRDQVLRVSNDRAGIRGRAVCLHIRHAFYTFFSSILHKNTNLKVIEVLFQISISVLYIWYPELSCLYTFSSHSWHQDFRSPESFQLGIWCICASPLCWDPHWQADTASYVWRWPVFGVEWISVTSHGCPEPSVLPEKELYSWDEFPQMCNNNAMPTSGGSAGDPFPWPLLGIQTVGPTVGALCWLYIVSMLPSPELKWK